MVGREAYRGRDGRGGQRDPAGEGRGRTIASMLLISITECFGARHSDCNNMKSIHPLCSPHTATRQLLYSHYVAAIQPLRSCHTVNMQLPCSCLAAIMQLLYNYSAAAWQSPSSCRKDTRQLPSPVFHAQLYFCTYMFLHTKAIKIFTLFIPEKQTWM